MIEHALIRVELFEKKATGEISHPKSATSTTAVPHRWRAVVYRLQRHVRKKN